MVSRRHLSYTDALQPRLCAEPHISNSGAYANGFSDRSNIWRDNRSLFSFLTKKDFLTYVRHHTDG